MKPVETIRYSELVDRLLPLMAELLLTLKVHDPLRVDLDALSNQTMLEFMRVLKRTEALTNEEIAMLIGRSLSAFYEKKKRLAAEPTAPSEFEAVYRHLLKRTNGRGLRQWELLSELPWLAEDRVAPMLKYMVRYGLLSVSRTGANAEYRVVGHEHHGGGRVHDVVVTLYSHGAMTLAQLAETTGVGEQDLELALGRLRETDALIEVGDGATRTFAVRHYYVGTNEPSGWHAAIWVHLKAVCDAIIQKVRAGEHTASQGDQFGGTTFEFVIPTDYPRYDEIVGFLDRTRTQMDAWLDEVRELPAPADAPDQTWHRVVIYTGQSVKKVDA